LLTYSRCWQDACCLVGTEKIVLSTFDDAKWVHELLHVLKRKKGFLQSSKGGRYDILELGGGDASTTVISPEIFNDLFHTLGTVDGGIVANGDIDTDVPLENIEAMYGAFLEFEW